MNKIFCIILCYIFLLILTGCATKSKTIYQNQNINTAFIKNPKLRQMADEWVGVPYKYGGNSKSGIDCSGFAKEVISQVYKKKTDARSAEDLYKISRKVSIYVIKEGDLVFFRIPTPKDYHVGIYLGERKFIHASSSKGVTIDDLNSGYYKEKFYIGGQL